MQRNSLWLRNDSQDERRIWKFRTIQSAHSAKFRSQWYVAFWYDPGTYLHWCHTAAVCFFHECYLLTRNYCFLAELLFHFAPFQLFVIFTVFLDRFTDFLCASDKTSISLYNFVILVINNQLIRLNLSNFSFRFCLNWQLNWL